MLEDTTMADPCNHCSWRNALACIRCFCHKHPEFCQIAPPDQPEVAAFQERFNLLREQIEGSSEPVAPELVLELAGLFDEYQFYDMSLLVVHSFPTLFPAPDAPNARLVARAMDIRFRALNAQGQADEAEHTGALAGYLHAVADRLER